MTTASERPPARDSLRAPFAQLTQPPRPEIQEAPGSDTTDQPATIPPQSGVRPPDRSTRPDDAIDSTEEWLDTTEARRRYGSCPTHKTTLTPERKCLLCEREEAKKKADRGWKLILVAAGAAVALGAAIAAMV